MATDQGLSLLLANAMMLLTAGILLAGLAGALPRIAGTVIILVSAVRNGINISRTVANRKS